MIILSICTYVWHVFVYIIVSQSIHEHGLLNFVLSSKISIKSMFHREYIIILTYEIKVLQKLKKKYYIRASV